MKNAPCMDCPSRREGCHSVCLRYWIYDARRKRERRERLEARETEIAARSSRRRAYGKGKRK